jgi:hypothetical protein
LIVEAAQEADALASVSVDMPEEYQITIPKSVTLDGSTKSGTYTVMVSGDLSGEEILSVTPDKTVSMSREDGASVSGTIVQSKTKWTSEAVGNSGKGTISVSGLSAGEWEGSFDFTVSMLDKESFEETITYTDFTLTADNYYMAGITRSGDVVIPETFEYDGKYYKITEIGDFCFYSCSSITSVVIPDSVTKIGIYAFWSSAIRSLSLGSFVNSIGNYAFGRCYKLTQLNIPVSVTSISSTAFNYCSSLESITVTEGNSVYTSDGSNAIINKTTNTLVAGCKNTVIPEYVTCIGAYAFFGQTALTTIRIPDSVTKIGSYAFRECSGLLSVYIPSGVTTISGDVFYDNNNGLLVFCGASEKQNGWGSNWNRRSSGNYYSVTYGITREKYEESIPFELTKDNYEMAGTERSGDVVIPEMFEYNGLKYKVVSIGANAFYDCSDMTSIQIPDSVTKIGANAFYGCSGLESIEIPASVLSIDTTSFNGTNFQTMSVAEENTVYDSRDNCNAIIITKSNTLLHGCANTLIPDSVTSIGSCAFGGCKGLTNIVIPEGVTSIGGAAFSGCIGLTTVTIPEGVKSITNETFYRCTGLESINIPDTVTSIGYYAFRGCSSLTSIDIPEDVTYIGYHAFYDCTSLTSITIPEGVVSIYSQTFDSCKNLKSIYIPSGVTSINSSVVKGCPSLKIYCGASEPQSGWAEGWNNGRPVTYGVTREEYETRYKE